MPIISQPLVTGSLKHVIISKSFITRTLEHAQDSKLLVTWTLKHDHNFKTPYYKDFEMCPSFQNSMYMLQVYIYNVFLLPYNDIY
jgi:hypothetical protein